MPVGVRLVGCDALRGAECHEVVLTTRPNIHLIPRSPSVVDTDEMDTTRNVLRRLAGEWLEAGQACVVARLWLVH